jgi:SAM-dependent methyltransferase
MTADGPALYGDLADWWPLLSPPEDYAEEAAFYERTLVSACARPPRTMLELGSGGGNNASYLKRRFRMTLVDLSPGMLDVSRSLNPECEHVVGDMRTVRLGRRFDCVFVHDAVSYMTSEADLRRAVETARAHCAPGGAVLFAPDYVKETFRPGTEHGGADGMGDRSGEALRYLEWVWDPDPADDTYTVDYVVVVREADGTARVVHDRHVEGLFARGRWLDLLSESGLQEPQSLPLEISSVDPGAHEVLVAVAAPSP